VGERELHYFRKRIFGFHLDKTQSRVDVYRIISEGAHGVEYFDSVLSGDIPTIPLKLRDFGYYSYAFTSSGHVDEETGFSKDFDAWT